MHLSAPTPQEATHPLCCPQPAHLDVRLGRDHRRRHGGWQKAASAGAQVEELAALSCRFTSLHCALRVCPCVHMCDHVAPPLPAAATAGVWIAAFSCDLRACHRQAVPRALVTCSPRTDGLFPDVLVVMSREVVGSCYFPLLGQGFLPTGAQAHLCFPLHSS